MLRSMTAFGRYSMERPYGHYSIELHSVNRKFLELHLNLRKELLRFEPAIRKILSKHISRGKISASIEIAWSKNSPLHFYPDFSLARSLQKAVSQLTEVCDVDGKALLKDLMLKENILVEEENFENAEQIEDDLSHALEQALADYDAMRVKEGKELAEDFLERLNTIERFVETVDSGAEAAKAHYRERLKKSVEDLLGASAPEDERILKELALYADRIDTCEESTRLKSHLKQAREAISSDQPCSGKKLDFLFTEMLREVNTISAKSPEVEKVSAALEAKCEVERLREQVQNIE